MGSRSSSFSNPSGNGQRYSMLLLLLLALGAAMFSALVVHKLREGRVLGLVLDDRERQLFALQMILQKERAHSKEMKIKIEELKAKAAALRILKTQLADRLYQAENVAGYLRTKQAELESALEEKQSRLSLKDMEGEHRADSTPEDGAAAGDGRTSTEATERTAKEEKENGEQLEKDSTGQQWVTLKTNPDDGGASADGEKDGAEEASSEEGRRLETEEEVNEQGETKLREENQINAIEAPNSTVKDGGEAAPVGEDEAGSSNTRETVVVGASEDDDDKLEKKKKDDNGDGSEEKRTTGKTERRHRGRRFRRSRGRKRKAAAGSREQHAEGSKLKDLQTPNNPQMEEGAVVDGGGNTAEIGDDGAQIKLPDDQQPVPTGERAAEVEQPETNAVSLEKSPGSGGDESSEAKASSIDGSDEKEKEKQKEKDDGEEEDKAAAARTEEDGEKNDGDKQEEGSSTEEKPGDGSAGHQTEEVGIGEEAAEEEGNKESSRETA